MAATRRRTAARRKQAAKVCALDRRSMFHISKALELCLCTRASASRSVLVRNER